MESVQLVQAGRKEPIGEIGVEKEAGGGKEAGWSLHGLMV